MIAAELAATWPLFARPLTVETADGATSAAIAGQLRGLRAEELVGGLDAGVLAFQALSADLEAAGLHPLPKYARVIDGTRTYTVEEAFDVYSGSSRVFTRAWVRG